MCNKSSCQATPVAPPPLHLRGQAANKGFTLVEIAIVLVVVGLLLGGILKGQELVNTAKVRLIADRQNSLKSAWYMFVDRFGGLPGDFAQANVYVTRAVPGDGNGIVEVSESQLAFQHLTSAGYLRCAQCTARARGGNPRPDNSVRNIYGGVMSIHHNDEQAFLGEPGFINSSRLSINSGRLIPSNILAEVDRKIDDGIANTGEFVFTEYVPTARIPTRPSLSECVKLDEAGTMNATDVGEPTPMFWRPANSPGGPVEQNCAAANYI